LNPFPFLPPLDQGLTEFDPTNLQEFAETTVAKNLDSGFCFALKERQENACAGD